MIPETLCAAGEVCSRRMGMFQRNPGQIAEEISAGTIPGPTLSS
jgi:hypothetical protein